MQSEQKTNLKVTVVLIDCLCLIAVQPGKILIDVGVGMTLGRGGGSLRSYQKGFQSYHPELPLPPSAHKILLP